MSIVFQLTQADNHAPVSGADVSAVRDCADGAIFWSCQVSTPNGPRQAVYRVGADGSHTSCPTAFVRQKIQ